MVHANELMLGDWVNYIGAYKDDSGEIVKLWESPVPIKVTFITPDAVQYEDEEGCYECADYELHPIPLTQEILEKNGFGFTRNDNTDSVWNGWWIYKGLELATACLNRDEKWPCFINIYDSNIKCEYVHQLQHALRLCGIEKEIVL